MGEDAISLGGSKLVQIWFSFRDLNTEVLNSWDLGRSAARLTDIDGDGASDVLARGRAEPAVILCRNDGSGELRAPLLLPFADAPAGGVGLVASPAVAGVVGVIETVPARRCRAFSGVV